MVQVLLSFDTEDYTSPLSDDAIYQLAMILAGQGVRGCFNFVGELAKTLRERGRTDIFEAMKAHEIDYHSYRHTWHPTMVEYTDSEDWEAGYKRFLQEESEGAQWVKDIFGVDRLWAFVPPGNCIAPQAIYGTPELDMPIYSGSLFKETGGAGIWYCNALNLENNFYIDHVLLTEGLEGVKSRIEEWSEWQRVIICCHPNIIPFTEYWDAVNLKGNNLVEWGAWKHPPVRPPEDVERFYADFAAAIRLIKEDGRFEFVTYEQLWKSIPNAQRSIPLQKLKALLAKAAERFFYQVDEEGSYSLADLFLASAHYLSGRNGTYFAGKAMGPMREPAGIEVPTVVTAKAVRAAAAGLANLSEVPDRISIPDPERPDLFIGPADFIAAAAGVLDGKASVTLVPARQMPDTSGFYRFDDFQLANTWMYPENFKDRWVTRRLKWQAWTIRPE